MKIKEILTSIQCDDAERCINLENLTFQSTILADIDTEKIAPKNLSQKIQILHPHSNPNLNPNPDPYSNRHPK